MVVGTKIPLEVHTIAGVLVVLVFSVNLCAIQPDRRLALRIFTDKIPAMLFIDDCHPLGLLAGPSPFLHLIVVVNAIQPT